MKQVEVNNIKKDEKLIYYIKNIFPNLSSSVLYKAIRNKDIRVNGIKIADQNITIHNGDILAIYIQDYLLYGFPKELTIEYEDENILVVYKPQGILSNNETNSIDEPTFEDFVKEKKGDSVKICHRLDRNTSGLLIFSKNDMAYSSILEAFKLGYVNKEYIAYVYGTSFDKDVLRLEKYIFKNEDDGFSKIYDNYVKGSQKIFTDIEVIKKVKKENYSILKVIIHTGKTHQIRAQLSAINHPIIGDSRYGKNDINKKFKKYKQLLFAVKYSFNFPSDNNLSYLNNISIELDKDLYTDKI